MVRLWVIRVQEAGFVLPLSESFTNTKAAFRCNFVLTTNVKVLVHFCVVLRTFWTIPFLELGMLHKVSWSREVGDSIATYFA